MNPRLNPTPSAILTVLLAAGLSCVARAAAAQSETQRDWPEGVCQQDRWIGYVPAYREYAEQADQRPVSPPKASTGAASNGDIVPRREDATTPCEDGLGTAGPADESANAHAVAQASFAQQQGARPVSETVDNGSITLPLPQFAAQYAEETEVVDSERFSGEFSSGSRPFDVGADFYSPPEFEGGLIVVGRDVAMKFGGYVKADFIYDFDPIDATDSFITTSIPVGAPDRTNARYHARQTRFSFDTRWASREHTVRIFVEGDFFGKGDGYRLRHAYGEVGSLLVGQTWTTFTDVAAAPATLDFEGSVSAVNRRQAQARWTQPIFCDDLTLALAVEDTRFIIETPVGITGDPRSPSPDFVGHLRLEREWGRFQIGGLYRILGVQPSGDSVQIFGEDVITAPAWGLNFTGVIRLGGCTQAYYQIVFGDGIGSYRGLPDAAPTAADDIGLLSLFGWMIGVTHDWTERLTSNFTYAENSLDTTVFQNPNDVHRTTYLAANLIWKPLERVRVGIEYLYGLRENIDLAVGSANRVQVAFIFDLP